MCWQQQQRIETESVWKKKVAKIILKKSVQNENGCNLLAQWFGGDQNCIFLIKVSIIENTESNLVDNFYGLLKYIVVFKKCSTI